MWATYRSGVIKSLHHHVVAAKFLNSLSMQRQCVYTCGLQLWGFRVNCARSTVEPVMDQWVKQPVSVRFSICLYLLHCSAASTGCSVYTFFFLPIHLAAVRVVRLHPVSLPLQRCIHWVCRWDQCCGTVCVMKAIIEHPELHYVQRELIMSRYYLFLIQSQRLPLWICKFVFCEVSKGSGLSDYSVRASPSSPDNLLLLTPHCVIL